MGHRCEVAFRKYFSLPPLTIATGVHRVIGISTVPASFARDMEQHHFADVACVQKLLQSDCLKRWHCESLNFSDLLNTFKPFRDEIQKHLGPLVKEAISTSDVSTKKSQEKGVEVVSLPGQGRSLLTTRHLKRGSVVLREYPLAKVLLGETPKKQQLHPETRLALKLWHLEKNDQSKIASATDLLDHGGQDAAAQRMRAFLAVCCVLCVDTAETDAVGKLFQWLGRVRVNAVAVTALVEGDEQGELEQAKVALALYPSLARSVNHSCRPNGVLRFDAQDSHVMDLVISCPDGVKTGEEVTISYGPMATSMPRSLRLSTLQSQYGFECRCCACSAISVDEDFQWKRKAEMLDTRAREAVARSAWQEAAIACSAAVAMLREGFQEGDIELAREECKLAGLTLRSGDATKAREIWASAAEVLDALVLRMDPDLREAKEMLQQLPTTASGQRESSSRPSPKTSERPCFASACNKREMARAFRGLFAAIETCVTTVKPGETTVTDSFTGAIYGLEHLSLSPAEKSKLMAAMANEPGEVHQPNARRRPKEKEADNCDWSCLSTWPWCDSRLN